LVLEYYPQYVISCSNGPKGKTLTIKLDNHRPQGS